MAINHANRTWYAREGGREAEGGSRRRSRLFFRLQITTGNGDNKIRKDTALITKQHEHNGESFLGNRWAHTMDDDDDASKLIFNAAIGNGRRKRCVSAFLLLPRLNAFLFKFTRIGKCQKVHSSLQREAQLVRGRAHDWLHPQNSNSTVERYFALSSSQIWVRMSTDLLG